MLGNAPLAATPLSDDGDQLPRIQARAIGQIALWGDSAARATLGVKANPGVVFSIGGNTAGNSSLTGRGLGDLTAEGNAYIIGATVAITAGTFTTTPKAAATLQTVGTINGNIELAGQSAGCTEGSLELRTAWNWHGFASAGSVTLASSSSRLELSGHAQGSASLQSGVVGSLALPQQIEVNAGLKGAATHDVGIEGAAEAAVQTLGHGTDTVLIAGHIAAVLEQRAAANSAMDISACSQAKATSTSWASAVEPALCGFAIGTTLETRFTDIAGQFGLSVSASAALTTNAITNAIAASALDAVGNVKARSVITGGLSLVRELNAGILTTGQANRVIGLAGAASVIAVTAADASAVGIKITGRSEAHGASVGSGRYVLKVSGQAELACTASGGIRNEMAWAGAIEAATRSDAVVKAEVSFLREATTKNSIHAIASTPFGFSTQITGAVRPVARMREQFGVAGDGSIEVSSLGKAHCVIDVARDFTGNTDVLGDSTPAITIVGHATLQSFAISTAASDAVNLTGSTHATNTSNAHGQALLLSEGTAQAHGTAMVSSHLSLRIRLFADGQSPLGVKSIGTWPAAGHIVATMSLVGSAQSALPIDTGAQKHATTAVNSIAGKTRPNIITAGSATAQAKSRASSQGRLALDRFGSVDMLVQGDALRRMSLSGASSVRITALAAANSMLYPSLRVSATNIIHFDFNAEAIAPDGGAAGSNLAKAPDVSVRWNVHSTAIAYRAPPALRRAEPPTCGLSGRLTPSNSGQILTG